LADVKLWRMIILLSTLLVLSACDFKPESPGKAGEIVTWKFNDRFIIKTKLGKRRHHIPDMHCPRCEAEFYRPQYVYYIGQFPIDHQPVKFAKLSEVEAKKLPVKAMAFPYGLEFYLYFNSPTALLTDINKVLIHELDDPDQVVVNVKPIYVDRLTRTTKQDFDHEHAVLDHNPILKNNGLTCYNRVYADGSGSKTCLGQSKNKLISGFRLYAPLGKDELLESKSTELMFGGVEIEWRTDQKNLAKAQQIDEAIWRLLSAWNVSPVKMDAPIKTYRNTLKTGDIVTWRVTPQLLINAKAGKLNTFEYNDPNGKFYLGQFPVDYRPKKILKINPKKIKDITDINNALNFDLIINNEKNVPIYDSSMYPLLNQVRVTSQPVKGFEPSKLTWPREKIDYVLSFYGGANKKLKYDTFGLECYPSGSGYDSVCIGTTGHPHHPQVYLYTSKNVHSENMTIYATSYTSLYGGLRVEWEATVKDLKNWKEIDAAIWRLLDTWNVFS
jgi:hypothetical protein